MPSLEVPLLDRCPSYHVVVFHPPDGRPPTVEGLRDAARGWIAIHAAEPLRPVLDALVARSLSIRVQKAAEVPLPPHMVPHQVRDKADGHRLRGEYAVVVGCEEQPGGPRPLLWAAIAASRAIASHLDGALINLVAQRLMPRSLLTAEVPDPRDFAAGQHILIPNSIRDDGLGLVTTVGLITFGLPELRLRHVPPHLLGSQAAQMVNGVAQVLVRSVSRLDPRAASPRSVTVDNPLRLTLSDVVASNPAEGAPVVDNAAVAIPISLAADDFIDLGHGGPEVAQLWLADTLATLFRTRPDIEMASGLDEELTKAHQRAVAELTSVKRRFASGLPLGSVLYVKAPFAHDEGQEFMWASVMTWTDRSLRATITADARWAKGLRAGTQVDIDESAVYDWYIGHKSGDTEGGYTTEVLLHRRN